MNSQQNLFRWINGELDDSMGEIQEDQRLKIFSKVASPFLQQFQ